MNTKRKAGQTCTGHISNSKVQKNPFQKSAAIKELERIAFEVKKIKYPSTPVEWLAKPTYRDDNANGLIRCILDFIRLTGGKAERISSLGSYIDSRCTFTDVLGRSRTIGSAGWISETRIMGTADIHAIIKDKGIKIEVNRGDTRPSEAQNYYQNQVQQKSQVYLLIKTFEQFFNWHKNFIGRIES